MASRAADTDFCTANDAAPRDWFSAAELAQLALPGMPADKRAINRRAAEERWTARSGPDGALLVRPRQGARGGGVEYHASLLPPAALLELARRGLTGQRPAPAAAAQDGSWAWYETQGAAVHAEAERRLAIVNALELLTASGMTRTAAAADIARRHGVGKSTLWSWLSLVDGVAAHNRLPALAPRRGGGGQAAEIDPLLWTMYKSDVLRAEKPTLTSCYERVAAKAAEIGLSLPCEKTFSRRLRREVDPGILKLLREGEEALRRSVPANRRTVENLHAMEVVNIDGHKFDVWVVPPKGGKPIRPIMVAIQDVRSSKIVGWRLGETESTALARLAVGDMIREFGIPKRMTCDNGRSFASKWFTGGIANRFRFTVQEDEPTGLLTALGIDVNWAIPGRGQSKPIERAFRDLADRVSRAPECAGAYTGPNPMAKPHNYGSRAVAWEEFREHVARCVKAHNARLGRTGRDYAGRSFDQVFAATSVEIGRATAEHMRLAMLAHERVRVDRQTAEVRLFGNRYWAEAAHRLAGQLVTVRFDPDNLHGQVHLYDGPRYLLTADLIHDSPWGTAEDAKKSAKRVADYRRRMRDGAEAEQLLTAEELVALRPADPDDAPPMPDNLPIRPHRWRGNAAPAAKPARARPAEAAVPALPEQGSKVLSLFGRLRLDD
ncbi:transposase domain-containing protein [Sphingomonas canadensis]|uniref:Transposase domain-containing protein n=1 Tax=Sphingomonas canadensis TaxID=1219257 RepID=A0ABW3H4I4_9SPHN|nr:transposase domain-containing protein [Sphingomonas canadensis]MCW3836002.1 Mu transposase C-terminal domain-containing protein [Sphingomonas canadensis]